MTTSPERPEEPLFSLAEDTRRAVYRFVADQRQAVGREVTARALGLSRSVAAYHLDRLAEVGLLEVEFRRPPGRSGPGAGRPSKLYRRSSEEFTASVPPRDYRLAAELLARAVASQPGGARVRSRLVEDARATGVAGAEAEVTGRRGFAALRRLMHERGYEPFDDGGTMRLRNCPFDALVDDHRDVVCAMNHAMLDGMCEVATAGSGRALLEPSETTCCVAFVKKRR